jgi:hypothetical protein
MVNTQFREFGTHKIALADPNDAEAKVFAEVM